jgi:hypothetical protein
LKILDKLGSTKDLSTKAKLNIDKAANKHIASEDNENRFVIRLYFLIFEMIIFFLLKVFKHKGVIRRARRAKAVSGRIREASLVSRVVVVARAVDSREVLRARVDSRAARRAARRDRAVVAVVAVEAAKDSERRRARNTNTVLFCLF